MKKTKIADVAIIGIGPAGMAAAIQLNKYCFDSLLLFGEGVGYGLLQNARMVENYLGFPEGISGIDLWHKFYEQMLKTKVKQVFQPVDSLDFIEQKKHFVITVGLDIYYARYVIVATGTKPKKLEHLKQDFSNQKDEIYYEISKLITQKDKDIVVVGAGDTAFDYALSISKANNVTILNRGTYVNAAPALKKQVMSVKNIIYYDNAHLVNIIPGTIKKLCVTLQQENHVFAKEFDYLLIAIGRVANKDFYTNNLHNLEEMLISSKLLFLAGDVKNDIYRQVAIAASDGILAAMRIKEQFI